MISTPFFPDLNLKFVQRGCRTANGSTSLATDMFGVDNGDVLIWKVHRFLVSVSYFMAVKQNMSLTMRMITHSAEVGKEIKPNKLRFFVLFRSHLVLLCTSDPELCSDGSGREKFDDDPESRPKTKKTQVDTYNMCKKKIHDRRMRSMISKRGRWDHQRRTSEPLAHHQTTGPPDLSELPGSHLTGPPDQTRPPPLLWDTTHRRTRDSTTLTPDTTWHQRAEQVNVTT